MMVGVIETLKKVTFLIEKERIASHNRKAGNKQGFNFFRGIVYNKTHLEKYHTNFLYYLLNPFENHNCNDLFLKEFFKLEKISSNFPVIKDFSSVVVRRERHVHSINRTIDITIEQNVNWIIFIENKVGSGEGYNQIQDYFNFSKTFNKQLGVLLTPDGRKPSSINNHDIDDIACLSYKEDIIYWLEKCTNKLIKYPHITTVLIQYLDSLRLTFNLIEDDEMDNITNYIKNNPAETQLLLKNRNILNMLLDDYSKTIRLEFIRKLRSRVMTKILESMKEIDILQKFNDSKAEFRYKDSEVYKLHLEGVDGEKGFWFGVDTENGNVDCNLDKKHWQELIYNNINFYQNTDEAAAIILAASQSTQNSEKLVEDISDIIYNLLSEKVFPAIKQIYYLGKRDLRKKIFNEVRESVKKELSNSDIIQVKGIVEDKIICKKDDTTYFLQISPDNPKGEDKGFGSWIGVYDQNDKGINCNLQNGHWEGIQLNGKNDFYSFIENSEFIDNVSENEKAILIQDVKNSLIERIKETFIESIK